MKKERFQTITVGLTGGIGSGKTDVCKIFELLGARVLYADLVARDLINSHSDIQKKIRKVFGENVFLSNGTLDRKQIAKLAFHDSALHEKLNAIVHPHVLRMIEQEIATEKESGHNPILIVEAALLFEAGADHLFDYVVVVDADEGKRIERVIRRDGCSREDVVARINSQMLVKEKVLKADFVLQNSGDRNALKEKCTFMFQLLRRIATSG
ncbi:MAG: dephospho-CoA kinase [Ignavibacteria bacterium]|nr:dephospho-CoA kinase [Ignavibacteria bacterium]MBI3765325.1 dephospho-CoA kinase [Ignavibacteriales bacterium]